MKSNTTRRSFLRGAGGSLLALPWLESIGASAAPSQRMAFYYVPIGVVRRGFFPGEANAVIPKFEGATVLKEIEKDVDIPVGSNPLPLTPTMEPLSELTDKFSLITGLDRTFQDGTDVHAQCASCFLSSAAPFSIKSSAWPLDRTLDHIVADHIGGSTPFRTLEFSCNSHRDNKESIYFDNISWYGTGHVAPSIRNPRVAYQRMFSTRETRNYRNITDLVLEDAKSMQRGLASSDQDKFEEYYESIRSIETQMDKLEKMRSQLANVDLSEPTDAYLPRGEYIRLMGDLMVAALQTGLTNIATFMVGPERWDTPFKFEGLFDKPMSHHKMSHNQREFIDQLLEVDRFHMEQYAYLIRKMDGIVEANGTTLLDNTIFTYGSGLGDGSTHQYTDLPILIAGTGGGKLRTGRHFNLPDGTPLSNLWMTQARAMGVDLPRFADSTGQLDLILA